MESYFDAVVNSLTLDDLNILGILVDNDATAKFKAIKNNTVCEKSGLSNANFRKTLYRLTANCFIKTATGNKEHLIYVTDFGQKALQKSLGEAQ